jgi:hypothetical protein
MQSSKTANAIIRLEEIRRINDASQQDGYNKSKSLLGIENRNIEILEIMLVSHRMIHSTTVFVAATIPY